MSRFSVLPPRSGDHWFRIGSLDVTSTVLVTLLICISVVASAFSVGWQQWSMFWAHNTLQGEVWRVVTWPLINPPTDAWILLSIAMFWYFGTTVEGLLGRSRMLWFLTILVVA